MRTSYRVILILIAALALGACTDTHADTAVGATAPTEGADTLRQPPPPVQSVLLALGSLPVEGLWPGFSPADVPVAIYDGRVTVLLAHPAPPAEFVPSPDLQNGLVYMGRHPAVRGNMPTEVNGVRTAAVMLEGLVGMTPERAAAVVTHERFHVHQLERHPGRTANELAVFQYPATDVQQLFDRRLETLALYRSIQAQTVDQSECWLRTALLLRRKRMSQLPESVAQYERAIEMQEGLARYIERRAAGLRVPIDIAPGGYPPDDVRGRAYVTGEVIGVMLDRYSSDWRDVVENSEDPPPLDSLLWLALEERPETSCGFSAGERTEVHERATAAVEALEAQRDTVRHAFENQPGWSIRVVADADPLWPQSFDPMSVSRVGRAALVHERMLRAGNEHGFIDVFGTRALSTGYADDPLGRGMREVRVTGIAERPAVASGEDIRVRVVADGVELSFRDAQVVTTGQEIVIRLQ